MNRFATLASRRHTALLIAIIGAFATRPLLGNGPIVPLVFSTAMLSLMLIALYTVQVDELVGERELLVKQRRQRSKIGWALAIPALVERMWALLAPSHELVLLSAVWWFLFFAYVTWNLVRSLLRQKEITGETIAMSISIYLLLGLSWAMLYIVIFQSHPEAFNLGTGAPTPVSSDDPNAYPVFVYFSLTTLSTLGFGDILPVSLPARYAAVAEGITGQFYLAILVARLVGMQMNQASAQGAAAAVPHRKSKAEHDDER